MAAPSANGPLVQKRAKGIMPLTWVPQPRLPLRKGLTLTLLGVLSLTGPALFCGILGDSSPTEFLSKSVEVV